MKKSFINSKLHNVELYVRKTLCAYFHNSETISSNYF